MDRWSVRRRRAEDVDPELRCDRVLPASTAVVIAAYRKN